jgi:hypothetical protein
VEPAAVKPVPERVQGQYYRQAIELAFCQPTVRSLLLFHTVDERDLNRWQSGLFYVDRKPKSDLPAVRQAMREAHRGVVARCPGMELRPRARTLRIAETPPVATLECDIDCSFTLTLLRGAARPVRAFRGRGVGALPKQIPLGRVRPGRYTLRAVLVAPANPGRPRTLERRFTVG